MILWQLELCAFAGAWGAPREVGVRESIVHGCFLPLLFVFFLCFGCTVQLLGSQFPDLGLNLGPLAVRLWHPEHWPARELPP